MCFSLIPKELDEALQHNTHCTLGLISRDGWAIVNDSKAAQFDDDAEWPWIKTVDPTTKTCDENYVSMVTCKPNDTEATTRTYCVDNVFEIVLCLF